MVAVLVILDGASEPGGATATSLERARTPALDELAAAGTLSRVRTVPAGLPAGSETAIPVLLGWTPAVPVDRGMIEAAARDVPLAEGQRAWRVDVVAADGGRAEETSVGRAADELRAAAPRHSVQPIGEHRLLLTGPPPLPIAAREGLRVWAEGALPPRLLGPATVVVAARGAAAGVARLMGADVVVPDGATGSLDTDLEAKAASALEAMARGAKQVVVHVGAPDEASHRRNPAAKVAAIERIDRELVTPLARAVMRAGGTLRVCPDHGCDPRTGIHDGDPVPCLTWSAGAGGNGGRMRLTERAVAELPATVPTSTCVEVW
ncbi:Metalloenzyme-type protein [Gaiella occulta]|uniref:Metalloenzyme-type protein n=1 Tax=Gaiella occulta TaxID=1002870 RepID=A0A7M2YTX0_9ACTN|nr:hypothetical protein [Gaiella occulta]RDI73591.1 Metalloenzyme-type protein [Gaiella occulta]